MNRLFLYFHPKMPLYMVSRVVRYKYDSDKFYKWFMRFSDISVGYKGLTTIRTKKAMFFWLSAYYFWVMYLFASVIVTIYNIYIGIGGVVISPLVVFGYLYSLCWGEEYLRRSLKIIKK